MRRRFGTALVVATLALGCAQEGAHRETQEMQEARETLRQAIEAALQTAEGGCEGCDRGTLEEALAGLRHPQSTLEATPDAFRAGTVWLANPGTFWTMTFGADGGLLGITATVTPHQYP